MANVLINEDTMTDIADAIRSKKGVETTYLPSEMPSAIESISGGVTPAGTKNISITENGTTTEDVTNYASAQITVDVPSSGGDVQHLTGTIIQNNEQKNTITIPVNLQNVEKFVAIVRLTKTGTVSDGVVTYDDVVTVRNQQIVTVQYQKLGSVSWEKDSTSKSATFGKYQVMGYVNTSNTYASYNVSDNQITFDTDSTTLSQSAAAFKFNFVGYYVEFTYDVYIF